MAESANDEINREKVTMFNKRTIGFLLVLVALAAGMASPSYAAAGDYRFEGYLGYYTPGLAELDNDYTFGARFGSRPSDNWGWEINVGMFDLNNDVDRPAAGTIGDANAYLVDFSGLWFPGGGNFALFAGVGFASVDIDIIGTTTDASDDAITWNLGTAYFWNVTEKFYIRPDLRWREIQGDTYDDTDMEYSIGFGWKF